MKIYLDANASTPVLAPARAAAEAAMAEHFGNPASPHGSGVRARALLEEVRNSARRVLGAPTGRLLFTSGATEAIHTAVLSALQALRLRRDAGQAIGRRLLHGATEHVAVPCALRHWQTLLGLELWVQAIPVGVDGRHDLGWLRAHVADAALVCTMAANNETGVVSDLDGIAGLLDGQAALWLVDGVQALGKLDLQLEQRRIDYAAFSGHAIYAPKGVGMLYVREGTPFTPLLAGGGQEEGLRAGTENMPGIAGLGAVLSALAAGGGTGLADMATLVAHRARLASALREAFPEVVFNAPFDTSLPTTLNIHVPGLGGEQLGNLLDAAGLEPGGSAASAARGRPSDVLMAMGQNARQAASAVRLSFGAADDATRIDEVCARLRACGETLARLRLDIVAREAPGPVQQVTRFVVDAACCYVVADAGSGQCVLIDPLPQLADPLAQWLRDHGLLVQAVLETHGHDHRLPWAQATREALGEQFVGSSAIDALGWPLALALAPITFGALQLSRLAIPGHTADSTAYMLVEGQALRLAFVGDTVLPGALGRSDLAQSTPGVFADSLRALYERVGLDTLLLPGHDYDDLFACTLRLECMAQPLLAGVLRGGLGGAVFAADKAVLEAGLPKSPYHAMVCGWRVDGGSAAEHVEIGPDRLRALLQSNAPPQLVDVREDDELPFGRGWHLLAERVPLSVLVNALPRWMALAPATPLVFVCRSGHRSAQAARALRRLGHMNSWALAGGLALWPASDQPRR